MDPVEPEVLEVPKDEEVEDTFSIVTKTKFNNVVANSILDSGAGVSVMDLGTFESLKIGGKIRAIEKCNDVLRDASDNQMDILGIAKIKVHVCGSGKHFNHNFRILNHRSYRNVIMGRDLMRKFKVVTFDFEKNAIHLDGRRIKGVSPPSRKVSVRTNEKLVIPGRSETVAVVTSNKDFAFVTGDFQPQKVPGQPNIYISKAMVTPNIEGKFVVTLVNTGNDPVTLRNRQVLGRLNRPDEIIASVDLSSISGDSEVNEIRQDMDDGRYGRWCQLVVSAKARIVKLADRVSGHICS